MSTVRCGKSLQKRKNRVGKIYLWLPLSAQTLEGLQHTRGLLDIHHPLSNHTPLVLAPSPIVQGPEAHDTTYPEPPVVAPSHPSPD